MRSLQLSGPLHWVEVLAVVRLKSSVANRSRLVVSAGYDAMVDDPTRARILNRASE